MSDLLGSVGTTPEAPKRGRGRPPKATVTPAAAAPAAPPANPVPSAAETPNTVATVTTEPPTVGGPPADPEADKGKGGTYQTTAVDRDSIPPDAELLAALEGSPLVEGLRAAAAVVDEFFPPVNETRVSEDGEVIPAGATGAVAKPFKYSWQRLQAEGKPL